MDSVSKEFNSLTKDQQYILSVLYKNYLECVKSGAVKITCNNFESAEDIQSNYFQKLHFEDVEQDLKKLKKYNFINGFFADNAIHKVTISDKTIVYFENEFKNNLKSIVDSISKIASIIPGL